jgi:hypothetical protein
MTTTRRLVPRIGGGDDWWTRAWLPAARDSLRYRRHMIGSRWWPLTVLWARAIACRTPEPDTGSQLGRWTCQRHIWHGGLHRFRNHVWSDTDTRTHHDPMPIHGHAVVFW